jgi:hypothetical protein
MDDRFAPYLRRYGQPLRDVFGVTPELINTGGGCMALELTLEGITLWVTDDGDPLSPWEWRRKAVGGTTSADVYGFAVRVYREDDPDDIGAACDPMYGDTMPEPDRLIALIRAAIDAARSGQYVDYGADVIIDYATDAVLPMSDASGDAAEYRTKYRPVLMPTIVARIRDGENITNIETGE